jgi:hypothetical protein
MRWLVILYLLPPALLAQDASLTLSGRVVDQVSGEPIRGATVTLNEAAARMQPVSQTTLSDANGGFTFTALKPSRYMITAQKRGYADPRLRAGQSRLLNVQSSMQGALARESETD